MGGVKYVSKKDEEVYISEKDWSLHQRGEQDQQRHLDKIKDAIKENLADMISEEEIITSNGEKKIKIPIKSLDEYKIRYNNEQKQHIGQGDENSNVGDIVAQDGNADDGSSSGSGAGNQPGEDVYETDVAITDIEELLFEQLELPYLKDKEEASIAINDIEYTDVRKKGLLGNIDKKRTILSALKRNSQKGKRTIAPILDDDLRFKTWDNVIRYESNAVILAMMDTSGSMGVFEKKLSRSFFFWMTRFLRSKYDHVDIVFIAHHTEAKVVTEYEFFHKGESGGTICSSAYKKALELIETKYHPDRYNIYPFHFSDGDNLVSDNKKCLALIDKLMQQSVLFGYGEINAYRRYSTLMHAYRKIDHPYFLHYILRKEQDVYHALTHFFKERQVINH